MAKSSIIITPTKVPSYYAIGIYFPNGKKIVKTKCSRNDLLETYFINLDNLIKKADSPEELYEKYEENYKKNNIKIAYVYYDSWGHKWTGNVAKPREVHFINYLKERMND